MHAVTKGLMNIPSIDTTPCSSIGTKGVQYCCTAYVTVLFLVRLPQRRCCDPRSTNASMGDSYLCVCCCKCEHTMVWLWVCASTGRITCCLCCLGWVCCIAASIARQAC
jgi:hypothetical protein